MPDFTQAEELQMFDTSECNFTSPLATESHQDICSSYLLPKGFDCDVSL